MAYLYTPVLTDVVGFTGTLTSSKGWFTTDGPVQTSMRLVGLSTGAINEVHSFKSQTEWPVDPDKTMYGGYAALNFVESGKVALGQILPILVVPDNDIITFQFSDIPELEAEVVIDIIFSYDWP